MTITPTNERMLDYPPTFTRVTDLNGVEIPRESTTNSSSVLLTGTGKAGERVEIQVDYVAKGTPTVSSAGVWELSLHNLTNGFHQLNAKALYGSDLADARYSFTVATLEAPSINSVLADGVVIPPGGTIPTPERVHINGYCKANSMVEIFDNAISLGKASALLNGIWELSFPGPSSGEHRLKARALYGSGAESAEYTFTVQGVPTGRPSITGSTDLQGNPVYKYGITKATTLVISGTID